jgi:hypothetical protein
MARDDDYDFGAGDGPREAVVSDLLVPLDESVDTLKAINANLNQLVPLVSLLFWIELLIALLVAVLIFK